MPQPADIDNAVAKKSSGNVRRKRVGKAEKPSILLLFLTTVYAFLIGTILVSHLVGPERWWLTGLNMYLPQWIWTWPLFILLPWYLIRARRWIWVPLVLLALVAWPVMGLDLHLWNHSPSGKGTRLRVMTYNIKWAQRDLDAIERDINDYKPDILLTQDSGHALDQPFGAYLRSHNWNIVSTDQYIVASRLPLANMDVRWISYPQHNHRVLRCNLQVGTQNVVVYDCHLASPRFGLAAMRHPRAGIAPLMENIETRLQQSARLAEHVRGEQGPVLLTGDLNAPVQSVVCKNLFQVGLRDAFSSAGGGYGYTYGQDTKIHRPYVRIDHIMTSPQWQILSSWVGNDTGSEHSPVFADLFLPDETK